ncbi:MAG: enoyl-CoA hydratase/isomerase family protein, partial [Chloroflexota bacterium]|nr:enoyl-CoA hydratase/isomerase family protein [Chloroflexota bacterium]
RAMALLHMHEVLQKIEHTPKIFVAAIAGHALGGGLEIALACDLRFAAQGEYRIGLPEVTLGIIPGNGGTQRLQRLIGATKALDLMITGKPVDPERAAALGLVDRLAEPERVVEESVAYVRELAAGSGPAVGHIKLAAKAGGELPLDGGLALEREAMRAACLSADAAEGLSAFVEKRKPNWPGR